MSEHKDHRVQQPTRANGGKREMTRRQFLGYTLGGTTAFLAAGPVLPMLRFAVDPLLQPASDSDWVRVVEESEITDEPKSFTFVVKQIDGWYESEPTLEAWIARGEDGKIFALNPTCKHLGCTVNWNSNPRFPNQYYCPCHDAHYTKEGKNLAVSPLPLDQYEVKIEGGFVYLGSLGPNQLVD
ncbi:ubiquinol-cytochrome c reductase iron-sulfur subunit [Paenibacillus senegalensis]|uniref:ubiquinol-cytochrome c reductase iron-sulfur subunit n=1 Tax=Paenibacillus senegalensis TaxID=1465766 RepID=UPI0002888809|nr:ubiquinol-cytochrome c reductase iron-sulfur subunit [Paenibacillus senegalensis]